MQRTQTNVGKLALSLVSVFKGDVWHDIRASAGCDSKAHCAREGLLSLAPCAVSCMHRLCRVVIRLNTLHVGPGRVSGTGYSYRSSFAGSRGSFE